jgi:hypothetical protein
MVVSKAYALHAATNRPAAIIVSVSQLHQSPPTGSIGVRLLHSTCPSKTGTISSSAIGSRLITPSVCCTRALYLIEKWLTQKISSSTPAPTSVPNVIEKGPNSTSSPGSGTTAC